MFFVIVVTNSGVKPVIQTVLFFDVNRASVHSDYRGCTEPAETVRRPARGLKLEPSATEVALIFGTWTSYLMTHHHVRILSFADFCSDRKMKRKTREIAEDSVEMTGTCAPVSVMAVHCSVHRLFARIVPYTQPTDSSERRPKGGASPAPLNGGILHLPKMSLPSNFFKLVQIQAFPFQIWSYKAAREPARLPRTDWACVSVCLPPTGATVVCRSLPQARAIALNGSSPRANYTDRATAACRRS
jgi:hypothetical protein